MFQNMLISIVTKFITVENISKLAAKLIAKLLAYARSKGGAAWDKAKDIIKAIVRWCNLFLEVYDDDTLTPEEEEKIANEIANLTDQETIDKIIDKIKK